MIRFHNSFKAAIYIWFLYLVPIFSRCPTGYTFYAPTMSCYLFVSTAMSWWNAASHCSSLYNGWLVTVNDLTEDNYLKGLASSNALNIWIGLSDEMSYNVYVWQQGVSSYRDFELGQPDHGSGIEHCIEIKSDIGGKWNDVYCGASVAFVCENYIVPTSQPSGYVCS